MDYVWMSHSSTLINTGSSSHAIDEIQDTESAAIIERLGYSLPLSLCAMLK